MSIESVRVRRGFAVALVAVGLFGLSACANPIEQLVSKGTEKAVEKLVEQGSGVDIDFDSENGGITYSGEDGDLTIGSNAQLPNNWPNIPTPDAPVVMSVSGEGGMQASFQMTQSEIDAFIAEFQASGFESEESLSMGAIQAQQFTDGEFKVMVQWIIDEDDVQQTLQMIVTLPSQ